MSAGDPRTRSGSIGPVLSFRDSAISLVRDSFCIAATERSPAGHTIYRLQFRVQTETPQGQPIIEECECWKRWSEFQQLANQLEQVHATSSNERLPVLVKANYLDRFKESVIEERRLSAESLLQFVSQRIHLATSAPLFNFIKGAAIVRILPITEYMTTPHQELDSSQPPSEGSHNISTGVRMSGEIDGVQEEGDGVSVATSNREMIRVDSMIVSQWGLEHNLKLRDEGDKSEEDGSNVDDSNIRPLSLATGAADISGPDDLPLPSTPKTPETSLIRHSGGNLGGSDWWSQALAQSDVLNVEDYDSLMDDTAAADQDTKTSPQKDKERLQLFAERNEDKRTSASQRRLSPSVPANGAYVVQAGKLITQGLEYETSGQYEESFDLFKAGVDVLLSGVQTDNNTARREAVRLKTAEYLQYAEILQRKLVKKKQKMELSKLETSKSNAKPHLLQDFKVLNIIANKVLLVESKHTSQKFIFKVLHKQVSLQDKTQLRGGFPRSKNRTPSQCPYMARLLHHYETQSNRIFLLLERVVQNRRLTDHVQSIRDHQLRLTGKRRTTNDKRRKRKKEPQETATAAAETPLTRVVIGQENDSIAPPISSDTPSPVPDSLQSSDQSHPVSTDGAGSEDNGAENSYVRRLMEQLTNLTPPTTSLGSVDSQSTEVQSEESEKEEVEEEMDLLSRLRKEVEELDVCKKEEDLTSVEENEEKTGNQSEEEDKEVKKSSEEEDKEVKKSSEEGDKEINTDSEEGDKKVNRSSEEVIGNEKDVKEEEEEEKASENAEDIQSEEELLKVIEMKLKEDDQEMMELEKKLMAFTSSSFPSESELTLQLDTGSKEISEALLQEIETKEVSSDTEETPGEASNDSITVTANNGPPLDDALLATDTTSVTIVPPTPTTPISEPLPIPIKSNVSGSSLSESPRLVEDIKKSSGQSTPQFSPVVSLRGSPEPASQVPTQDWELQLENDLRKWAAQIVLALEHLHTNGVICKDLHPDNILISESGDVKLTYFGKWDYVPDEIQMEAIQKMYVAPELQGLEDATVSADWWSMGAILFELLTGKLLVHCHPGGVHSHIPIVIPGIVSPEARSFLQQLLHVSPLERIGSGLNGIDDIKSHPFFSTIDWRELYQKS